MMITLAKRIWYGEPAFVLGLINTILVTLVATGNMPMWVGWAAAVSTALSTFVLRANVESQGDVTGFAVLTGSGE
jgi:hypothetical protein